MNTAEILISENSGIYNIKVVGRATYECCPPLREMAGNINLEQFNKISIDLKKCTAMDSTFMGILAMLGLKARNNSATIEIVNADEQNIELLDGLGLKKLFEFVDKEDEDTEKSWGKVEAEEDKIETAETVLEAHETLINVDESLNAPKFDAVVDMVKKDVDKLKNKK